MSLHFMSCGKRRQQSFVLESSASSRGPRTLNPARKIHRPTVVQLYGHGGFPTDIPTYRERVLYRQPTGANPLHHRDDLVDRPRAMGVPGGLISSFLANIHLHG